MKRTRLGGISHECSPFAPVDLPTKLTFAGALHLQCPRTDETASALEVELLEIEKRKIEIDAKLSVAKFARKPLSISALASGRTSNASVAGFRMNRDLG